MVVCVCNCNLVWTRSVCAASVTTFSSCDTVSTEVVYVENGVQNEVSQMVKGWGVCNCNFTWTIKHLCVFTACNASLSQRDECGPTWCTLQDTMRDLKTVHIHNNCTGCMDCSRCMIWSRRGQGVAVVHELWIYWIWDPNHCTGEVGIVASAHHTMYKRKSGSWMLAVPALFIGGHRDQNRMLPWPPSAILHSPHLQLGRPGNIYSKDYIIPCLFNLIKLQPFYIVHMSEASDFDETRIYIL